MRWLFCLLLLLAAPVSAAPPACAPDIVGPWAGKVWDSGRTKELRSEFSTATGELTGFYHVEDEDGGYDGTLTDFLPTGPCAGRFTWHDRFGDGVVWIDFRPDADRFDGEWGGQLPVSGYFFNGRRFRPVPVS